jgi:hypothetical protein
VLAAFLDGGDESASQVDDNGHEEELEEPGGTRRARIL